MLFRSNRLDLPLLDSVDGAAGVTGEGVGSAVGSVREALAGLGYGHDEIRDALREVGGDASDASTLLRDALKVLGSRRA
mgnify:FL=1